MKLENIKPERVFYYFGNVCDVPHGSGDMSGIRRLLKNFAINHNLEYVTEFTICSGDCIMWDGDTYCEAGVYAKTITSEVTGHISVVAALKLNVVESSRHIEYVNICYGVTYNFRGKYISQTGVYSDTPDS